MCQNSVVRHMVVLDYRLENDRPSCSLGKFFFQLVFAGTAATIVSGCVAERIKYVSFIVFSALLVAFAYPIAGHWIWGGGWLAQKGFWDFAGSTAVSNVLGSGRQKGYTESYRGAKYFYSRVFFESRKISSFRLDSGRNPLGKEFLMLDSRQHHSGMTKTRL